MQIGMAVINQREKANSVDPGETAHELSYLDVHCLQKYLFRPTRLKGQHTISPDNTMTVLSVAFVPIPSICFFHLEIVFSDNRK